MKRNIIISTIIGALATYLPFWQWECPCQQLIAAASMSGIVFGVLEDTENAP